MRGRLELAALIALASLPFDVVSTPPTPRAPHRQTLRPIDPRQEAIAAHNAEIDRRKAEKRARKAAK